MCSVSFAQESSESGFGIFPEIAGEQGTTYINLFDVILSDDSSTDVTITAGDDCFWIGGITGYAGGYDDNAFGLPITVFTNCNTENTFITVGQNADGISDIVGSGFFSDEMAELMGAPFDCPTSFELVNCEAR